VNIAALELSLYLLSRKTTANFVQTVRADESDASGNQDRYGRADSTALLSDNCRSELMDQSCDRITGVLISEQHLFVL
jgi:hypothetical protein